MTCPDCNTNDKILERSVDVNRRFIDYVVSIGSNSSDTVLMAVMEDAISVVQDKVAFMKVKMVQATPVSKA
jgi:hypothetical protein